MTTREVSKFEQALVVFVFIIYSYCFNYPLNSNFDNPVFLRVFQISTKIVAALLVLRFFVNHSEILVRTITQSKVLVCFLALCLASVGWAVDSFVSLKEFCLLLLSVSFAAYLACTFSLANFLCLVVATNGFGALLSLLMWWLYPQETWASLTMGADGAPIFGFKGSYSHKNQLALAMNTSILCAFFLWKMRHISRLLAFLLFGVFSFLLLCSRSATNYVGLILIVGLCLLTNLFVISSPGRRKKMLIATFLVLCFVVPPVVGTNYHRIVKVLDRSPSLTARVDIWTFTWKGIKERPLLGYGFNTFWPKSKEITKFPGAAFWSSRLVATPNAHNGYLDLMASTGLVGFFLFLSFVLNHLFRQLNSLIKNQDESPRLIEAAFKTSFFLFMLYINVFESLFMSTRYSYLLTIFYLAFLGGTQARIKSSLAIPSLSRPSEGT